MVASMTTTLLLTSASLSVGDDTEKWAKFKTEYGRSFATAEEDEIRFQAFQRSLAEASRLAERNPLARFGPTDFSDWTEGELASMYNPELEGYEAGAPCPGGHDVLCCELPPDPKDILSVRDLPVSWDWRTKGAVTSVKSQGACGSCWAFATAGTIEGQWAAAGNPLVDVSVQQIVACNVDDLGCRGGRVDTALRWLARTRSGNAEADEQYPYVSGTGSSPPCGDLSCWSISPAVTDIWCANNCWAAVPNCPPSLCTCNGTNPKEKIAATITGCRDLPRDENQMAAVLVEKGPFAVAIDSTTWTTYRGGIMTDCPSGAHNHGVLVVGYGTESSQKYWIIKNSWGHGWGEEGYIRLAFGSDQCSMTYRPIMAIAKSSNVTRMV